MVSTTDSYRAIAVNLDRSLRTTATKPDVTRETSYYRANIGKVKSIAEFTGNQRLFAYAMKAFGLGDLTYAKAFMAKVLREGVDKADSFANSLNDRRYRDFARAFDFKQYGAQATAVAAAQQGTIDRFVRQTLEADAGQQDEGVRLALYFERRSSTVTTAFSILADAALLKVAQVALGLPAEMSRSNIDKQAAMIDQRLKVADLADPKKLRAFLARFTVQWEAAKGGSAPTGQIAIGSSARAGISADLAASLQTLRRKA